MSCRPIQGGFLTYVSQVADGRQLSKNKSCLSIKDVTIYPRSVL